MQINISKKVFEILFPGRPLFSKIVEGFQKFFKICVNMKFQIGVGLTNPFQTRATTKTRFWLLQLLWVQILLRMQPFLCWFKSVEFVALASASKGVQVPFPNFASWNSWNKFSKSMTLPFLDDSFHLASNDDIEPIYYSEQQYFHWKNRNNMLFIRYLRTAWATPSPDMGPKIPFLLYDNGFNCENWSSCWCDIDGLFWFSIVNPD